MIASSAGGLELLSHPSGGWVIKLLGDNVADPALLAAAAAFLQSFSSDHWQMFLSKTRFSGLKSIFGIWCK